MHARLTADTDLIRAYGSASAGQAADLQTVAARLAAVGPDPALFGPIGAAFATRLSRAVARETETLGGLSAALAGAHRAAEHAAANYLSTDGGAGARILGGW